MEVENVVSVSIPLALIKKQLVAFSSFSLVFGFIGRISTRYEMLNWIYGPSILGYIGAMDCIQYLTKGLISHWIWGSVGGRISFKRTDFFGSISHISFQRDDYPGGE